MKQRKSTSSLDNLKASEIGLYVSLRILLPLCVSVAFPVLLSIGIVQTSLLENLVEKFFSFELNDNHNNSKIAEIELLEKVSVSNFPGNLEKIVDISFSPDNQKIVAVSEDSTIKVWNLQGKTIGNFQGNLGKVADISFSPDNQKIVAVSENSTIKVWNLQGKTIGSFQGNLGKIANISFSSDSKRIVTVTEKNNNNIEVWGITNIFDQSNDKDKNISM